MKILIDVNLSPDWVEVFRHNGIDSVHWTSVGDSRAKDRDIMQWARNQGHVVFTHDLDFGALLALTRATGPSVLQVRTQDILPAAISSIVLEVLRSHKDVLKRGAIISIDKVTSRIRILPILPKPEKGNEPL